MRFPARQLSAAIAALIAAGAVGGTAFIARRKYGSNGKRKIWLEELPDSGEPEAESDT